MEHHKRRIHSLLINPSRLDVLKKPINKIIKPTQIYNDYSLPLSQNNYSNHSVSPPKVENKQKPEKSVDMKAYANNYGFHKSPTKYLSDSSVSTANSRRSQVATPSPIKHTGRLVVSRHSSQNYNKDFPLFPYALNELKKETTTVGRKLTLGKGFKE